MNNSIPTTIAKSVMFYQIDSPVVWGFCVFLNKPHVSFLSMKTRSLAPKVLKREENPPHIFREKQGGKN